MLIDSVEPECFPVNVCKALEQNKRETVALEQQRREAEALGKQPCSGLTFTRCDY